MKPPPEGAAGAAAGCADKPAPRAKPETAAGAAVEPKVRPAAVACGAALRPNVLPAAGVPKEKPPPVAAAVVFTWLPKLNEL